MADNADNRTLTEADLHDRRFVDRFQQCLCPMLEKAGSYKGF